MAATPSGTLVAADAKETAMVDTTVRQLQSLWRDSEIKIHQLRKLRFMKTKATAPRPFQRVIAGGVRSPLSYRLVQAITGMITKDRPIFKRLPLDRQDVDAASRLQASADPLLQDLERLARRPLYYQFVDALVADGRGIMKCYRDAWGGFPMQGEDEPAADYNNRVAQFVMRGATHPLRMRLVDAVNFKMPLVEYEPPYVMEGGLRMTLAICEQFGLRFGVNNRLETLPDATPFSVLELPSGIPPTLEVIELWTDDTMYVRVGGPAGGGTVFKDVNPLGFIPYVWAAGDTSSHPDPSLNALSVLYPYAGIEPWLNTMLTVLAAWGVIGGTPILYTSRDASPNAGSMPDAGPNLSDIPLGKRIDLGVGGKIGFVTPPPVGREVLEYIQFLMDFLDRAGLPSLAYGNIGSRTPGTAFQGALEQAIAKVSPITHAAEDAMAQIVQTQWRIVESIGKPMVVTGIGVQPKNVFRRKQLGRYVIDPKDIGGYYDLHAKIRVNNTQDLISRGMHSAFMRSHKLWSRDRAMEYADVEDPFDEYKHIMRDTLEESPLVQQITLQQALQQEPELQKRAQALADQGIDIGALLTGQASGPGQAFPGKSTAVAPGGGSSPAGSQPAPARGGKPTGLPKRPGGPRQNRQGSRGHS